MEIAQILEELAYDLGGLPREAIETAVTKKEQITPHLLNILEESIQRVDEVIEDDSYQGHLYALYLLAQFREERALRPIVQLFSFPGEIPYIIAGDILTEDLSRILASVCGTHFEKLCALIENPTANEYVRAACQTALVISVGCSKMTRAEVVTYFSSLFATKLERVPSFAWDNLIACSCSLYPDELYSHIEQAFRDRLIDTSFICQEDVSRILAEEKQNWLLHLFHSTELIDDTVSEMEKWLTVN